MYQRCTENCTAMIIKFLLIISYLKVYTIIYVGTTKIDCAYTKTRMVSDNMILKLHCHEWRLNSFHILYGDNIWGWPWVFQDQNYA